MKVQLKIVDSAGTHYYIPQATVGTSWTQIWGTYDVTWTGTLTSATFFVSCENQTVDTYVDDCSLAKN